MYCFCPSLSLLFVGLLILEDVCVDCGCLLLFHLNVLMILFCSSGLRRAHTVDDWLVGIACEEMLHVCHGTAVGLTAASQVHAFTLRRNLAPKQDWLPELDC